MKLSIGSYNLNDFTENTNSEVKRLKAQVELFFSKELDIYTQCGLKDGMKVIECGCGPGFLLMHLAQNHPNSSYTGIEIDPELFSVFQSNIDNNKAFDITGKQGSIYSIDEADGTFDVAFSRLVLEHLDKPLDALSELIRILKPGGKLIIISNDFEYHLVTNPDIPELDLMFKAYCQSRIDEGGNPYIGRELPNLFVKKGLKNIDINAVVAHNAINGNKAMQKAENVNISRSLVKSGHLQQETLNNLTNKWYEMLQNPEHSILRQLFIISGEKPVSGSDSDSAGKNIAATGVTANSPDRGGKQITQAGVCSFLIETLKTSFEDDTMEIDEAVKLKEYFIDSLIATELATEIKSKFNVQIKLSDILSNFSTNDLATIIVENETDVKEENSPDESTWTEGEL